MALALLFALALAGADQPATPPPAADQPAASTGPEAPKADAPKADPTIGDAPKGVGTITEKVPTREEMEDAIPEGAPQDDYGFVAWCHGALAGQVELDPIVEKDMDAIEGKEKAAKRRASDAEITKEHRRYLALYEKALVAAEKASPTAIHQQGVDAELAGYKIWGPTRNKQPVWRMVDWGNWEVPPRCEKAAKRLYDRAALLGVALKTEDVPAVGAAGDTAPAADAPATATSSPGASDPAIKESAGASPPAPATGQIDPAKVAAPATDAEAKPPPDGLRGPK